MNSQGILMNSMSTDLINLQVDVSQYVPGVYFLLTHTPENNAVDVKKIIKT